MVKRLNFSSTGIWKSGICRLCSKSGYAHHCYGFLPGCVFDTKMVREPHLSKLIASRLARMHSARSSANGLLPQACLFPLFSKYMGLVSQSFHDEDKDMRFKSIIPSKESLENEISLLQKEYSKLDSPVVFCHNDLLLKNMIYNKEKDEVFFIDYEYADYNYQAFDIGNHFCEFAGVEGYDPQLYPDPDFQRRWLRDYLEAWYGENDRDPLEITDHDVQRLYVQVNMFALAAHLFWGVWALIQAAHSTLDFDYIGYAKDKIGEYFARKDEFLSLKSKLTDQNHSSNA